MTNLELTILEIARTALAMASCREQIVDVLDLTDEDVYRIQENLNATLFEEDVRFIPEYRTNEVMRKAVGKQMLIDSVMRQMVRDIQMHDFTAIEELLKQVPEDYLKGFLPEGETA